MKHGENKHLAGINAAAKSLSNLYNDMEYLIKRERGLFVKERVDLGEALLQRTAYFTEIAQMKGIDFECKVSVGCIASINVAKLYRLIDNNLSNAVKYSNENSKIEATLTKISDDKAVMSIKDFGIGIENPDKIFDRYYREELSKGGFGLGLNIVKNICEDESIKIDIVSKIDEGSEFRYIFTLRAEAISCASI